MFISSFRTAPPGNAASGGVPAWAAGLATGAWTPLPSVATFRTAATALAPSIAYRGNDPIGSIFNAYCDPALDAAGGQYHHGGGHGDGSCNAIFFRDPNTLLWSMVAAPSPVSGYLPDYMTGVTTSPVYPSGLRFLPVDTNAPSEPYGYFLTTAQDSDPSDAAYMVPNLARVSSHMYAAACKVGNKLFYFYNWFGVYDLTLSQWSNAARLVGIGTLVNAFTPSAGGGATYANSSLQFGTTAEYDPITDRCYVTLIGGGFRSSMIVFNPNTLAVEQIIDTGATGNLQSLATMTAVGRNLYCFNPPTYGGPSGTMDTGQMFNMDSKTWKSFATTGVSSGSFISGSNLQDVIPTWSDGARLLRWNYVDATERGNIYIVDVSSPTGGSGANPSVPVLLTQTRFTPTGTPPGGAAYMYKRTHHIQAANASIFDVDADHVPIVLRIP